VERAGFGQEARQSREVHAPDGQLIRPETHFPQARLCAGQFQGIYVEAPEVAGGTKAGQELGGVAAIAQGCVQELLPCLGFNTSRISATMMGRWVPAGVWPRARTLSCSAAKRPGSSSLYFSSKRWDGCPYSGRGG